jgi:hypothetical protein
MLTHERSTVFQVLLVVRDSVAGQVVTREIESMSSPKIVLKCQSARHRGL